jgi:hypothetical protein
VADPARAVGGVESGIVEEGMRVPACATSGGARKVCCITTSNLQNIIAGSKMVEELLPWPLKIEGTGRSVDTSHGLHPSPTK